MCEPTTIAMMTFAMSAGSTAMSHKAASHQAKVQDALHRQNTLNSQQALRDQYLSLQTRQSQEIEAASQQIQQRTQQAIRDRATATVASAEAGVSGFSVERILRDMGATASRDISTIEQNRDWTMSQLSDESKGIATQTQSRINSVAKGVSPSPWALGFKLGQSAINAYSLKGRLEEK